MCMFCCLWLKILLQLFKTFIWFKRDKAALLILKVADLG